MIIRTHWVATCMSLAFVFGNNVQAAEVAGMIKTSKGQVTIERGQLQLNGTAGTAVYVADRLRTGNDSAVGITLRDGTLLSAGPSSLVVIEKFSYDSSSHDGLMSIGVRKGTLSVASGKIAKKTPESVDFHTPTSVLGVRGTEFVIEVAGGDAE